MYAAIGALKFGRIGFSQPQRTEGHANMLSSGVFRFYHLSVMMLVGCTAVFKEGFETATFGNTFNAATAFSYPSFWATVSPLKASCVNTLVSSGGKAWRCNGRELQSGVLCKSPACGRPPNFPNDDFYLPIDFQAPSTFQTHGLGPRGSPSELEMTHIAVRGS